MNLVEYLEKAIENKDWSLINKALILINGYNKNTNVDIVQSSNKEENKNPFLINKPVINKKENQTFEPMQNKFVDDLSLESNLIEKSPQNISKKYRKPAEDNYVDVKCSKCGATSSITLAEQRFRSIDSESAPFTCIKCIRSNRRS
jgi:DNA-directed RNA polymerase subunit M/transcription elongation factor TFIIS